MSKYHQKATIKGMGETLGLHHTTVSKALRGSTQISVKTRLKVSELAKKLRYHPNQIARSLRSNSTDTIGLILPYVTPPYYATLLDTLNIAVRRRGLHLEVHFHQWDCQQEIEAVRQLLERRARGALICPADPSSLRKLEEILSPEDNLPVVLLASSSDEMPPFVSARVAPDLRRGAHILGQHLLERGHRRIALLIPTSRGEQIECNVHVVGLQEALKDVPGTGLTIVTIPPEENLLKGDQEEGGATQSLAKAEMLAAQFMQKRPRPTVAVTVDESIAHVLMSQLHAAKIRVPQDVSLACFGGTYLSEFGLLPLTTLNQEFALMADAAMELVTSTTRRNQRAKPIVQLIKPVLVARESVARL